MGSEIPHRIGWVGVRLVFLLLFFNLKGSNKVTLGAREFSSEVSGYSDPREKLSNPDLPSPPLQKQCHIIT